MERIMHAQNILRHKIISSVLLLNCVTIGLFQGVFYGAPVSAKDLLWLINRILRWAVPGNPFFVGSSTVISRALILVSLALPTEISFFSFKFSSQFLFGELLLCFLFVCFGGF